MSTNAPPSFGLPRAFLYVLVFGMFLTLRGYHSRDGDQAYRLPLLLHQQDPSLFADDPFVRAFDTFNPHRGYLTLLDIASRPLGLSAGLGILFALTFAGTCLGLDRLARAVWPEGGPTVGVVAVVLVLIAKAGNIGTNHLFEAMLLDRLIGFALGWMALALVVERPTRGWWAAPPLLGAAVLIHPSVGLQLALLLGATWIGWASWKAGTDVDARMTVRALIALAMALAPGLAMNLGQGGRLFDGLPADEFRLLSVEVQGPQHLLPHLWRLPQWLAWACFPALAALALGVAEMSKAQAAKSEERRSRVPGDGAPSYEHFVGWALPTAVRKAWWAMPTLHGLEPPNGGARRRLAVLLIMNLLGLAVAWVGVDVVQDLRLTLFQPFRMATVLRGLALVVLSGRVLGLWRRGSWSDRSRAVLLAVGLAGDWSFVVATAFELTMSALERWPVASRFRVVGGGLVLAGGLAFLARHDTEAGHVPLLAAIGTLAILALALRGRSLAWNRRRMVWATMLCWAVPVAAIVASLSTDRERPWAHAVLERCRFAAAPTDDIERLAVWCRDHTPVSARFIGPPGPKTFRLWSLRNLAFNRAGSPYHAAGLADWSARFRDHVGFDGPSSAFVRAYQSDRHGLERRYDAMSDAELAALATRQGASYLVASAASRRESSVSTSSGPLERLHVEGRYAVYRVRPSEVVARAEGASAGR